MDSSELKQNLSVFSETVAQEVKAVRTLLNGNKRTLSLLNTSSKSNLVAAINEIFQLAQAPVSLEAIDIAINDYFTLHPQSFDYEQLTPASIWDFVHPLDHNPSVVITDSAGSIWNGDVSYPTSNRVRVAFNFPLAGKANLS